MDKEEVRKILDENTVGGNDIWSPVHVDWLTVKEILEEVLGNHLSEVSPLEALRDVPEPPVRYPRCGGDDWEVECEYYAVHRRPLLSGLPMPEKVAYLEIRREWHGGYNSGHPYDDVTLIE